MSHKTKPSIQHSRKSSARADSEPTIRPYSSSIVYEEVQDDLVFDPENMVLMCLEDKKSSLGADSDHVDEKLETPKSQRSRRWLKVASLLVLTLTVGAFLMITETRMQTGMYTLKARLVYITEDPNTKNLQELKSPEAIVAAAQELCAHGTECIDDGKTLRAQSNAWINSTLDNAAAFRPSRLTDSRLLAQWLLEELQVESERSGNTQKIDLTCKGDDVEWLRTVIDTYVRQLVKRRTALETESLAQARLVASDIEPTPESNPSSESDDELKKLEQQEHDLSLAMKLMDSGSGSFGGFIPGTHFAGMPSLARFQDKIVELEIKKRGLLVQFTPKSQEVRTIDKEIKGVKAAMRECLMEYAKFLKSGKQSILSNRESTRRISAQTPIRKPCRAKSSGVLSNGDIWFRIPGGLLVMNNSPTVLERPLLVRAGEYTRKTLASLPGGSFITQVMFPPLEIDQRESTHVSAAHGNHGEHKDVSSWSVSSGQGRKGPVRTGPDDSVNDLQSTQQSVTGQ